MNVLVGQDVFGLLNSASSIDRFQRRELTTSDFGCGYNYRLLSQGFLLCLSGAPVPDCDRKRHEYAPNDCPVKLGQDVTIDSKFRLQQTQKMHALFGLFDEQFSMFVPCKSVIYYMVEPRNLKCSTISTM